MLMPVAAAARRLSLLLGCVALTGVAVAQQAAAAPVPKIDGAWWQVAGNPDLGDLTSPIQQPVDFSIWQAADGTWQILSCIRLTLAPGLTRVFHRWEGQNITDQDWQPKGVAMQADPVLGEQPGGLQAPHVFRWNGLFYMVYGDWNRICLAKSTDGKVFTRVLNGNGQPDLFTGPYFNTRDPMVLRHDDLFYCYSMGSNPGGQYESAVFLRTSANLRQWSEPMNVCAGGLPVANPFDAECPFVIERQGWFYLFRNLVYGAVPVNLQYASRNPMSFGVGDDRYRIGFLPVAAPEIVVHQGQYYIAALTLGLDGIRIARLRWVTP